MTRLQRHLMAITAMLAVWPSLSAGAEMDNEIAYLLNAQSSSDCSFIRNDISYSAREFQQHLQSKMQLNNEIVSSAEEFIEKIGTRSAISDAPYVAVCDGELIILKDWFSELLESYRAN